MAAPAFAILIVGVVLAHLVEPGVRVEKVVLAGATPAIHLFPSASGSHPVVLLAHGVTASKETLFRFGEALAAAGFDCYAVDLPGHGESRLAFSSSNIVAQMGRITRVLGPVDVFVGHSMGAGAGQASVWNDDLHPKLFIAAGANPDLGEHGPQLLLLAGVFEELVSPARLKARSDARLVLSPWSDHALEVWDPRLVNAGVEAACTAVGIPQPPAPRVWLWRLAGMMLGMAGILGLLWVLPKLSSRLAQMRDIFVPAALIAAVSLTTETWVGSTPSLSRIPFQLAIGVIVWVVLAGLRKLGLPRWSLVALIIMLTLLCVVLQFRPAAASSDWGIALRLLSIIGALSILVAAAGLVVGKMAAQGSRRDGELAVTIFIGYAIGQWMPRFF
jgi:pimeloyl-ACP methyl ester carboxylesterase